MRVVLDTNTLLAQHVIPASISAHIKDDPDDDAVLACALQRRCDSSAEAKYPEPRHGTGHGAILPILRTGFLKIAAVTMMH